MNQPQVQKKQGIGLKMEPVPKSDDGLHKGIGRGGNIYRIILKNGIFRIDLKIKKPLNGIIRLKVLSWGLNNLIKYAYC